MSEQILPNIYKFEIPLPGSPLKALNSYLIKGDDRNLLIDSGWNRDECKAKMFSEIEAMKVDLNRTDFFITHLHADHSGLVASLASATSTIYFNYKEAPIVNMESAKKGAWDTRLNDIYVLNGFPGEQLTQSFKTHPGRRYGSPRPLNFHVVREGDVIKAADYTFKCIETPGHSLGHICLYDASKKLLIAGDHILFDITPNITYWIDMPDSLRRYLDSLDKVYPLDVSLVLPGHRRIVENHRRRIMELHEHHEQRLNEVITALKSGKKNVFDVAPHVTWDIVYKSWDTFPLTQKWFAFGETLAHLKYLEQDGKVKEEATDGKIMFSLV